MSKDIERLEEAVMRVDFDDLETLAEVETALTDLSEDAVDSDEQMTNCLFFDAVGHSGLDCSCATCMQWRVPDLRHMIQAFPENACSPEIEDLVHAYVTYVLAWAKDDGIRFREIMEAAQENEDYGQETKEELQKALDFLDLYKELPSGEDAYENLLVEISNAGLKAKNNHVVALLRLFHIFMHHKGAL